MSSYVAEKEVRVNTLSPIGDGEAQVMKEKKLLRQFEALFG